MAQAFVLLRQSQHGRLVNMGSGAGSFGRLERLLAHRAPTMGPAGGFFRDGLPLPC